MPMRGRCESTLTMNRESQERRVSQTETPHGSQHQAHLFGGLGEQVLGIHTAHVQTIAHATLVYQAFFPDVRET